MRECMSHRVRACMHNHVGPFFREVHVSSRELESCILIGLCCVSGLMTARAEVLKITHPRSVFINLSLHDLTSNHFQVFIFTQPYRQIPTGKKIQ